MGERLHHAALCVRDLDASIRFYRDGLGLDMLMDHVFDGDWPALFGSPSSRLRSVFLGDRRRPDAGVVELVVFDPPAGDAIAGERPPGPPASGFFLLSFFVDVDQAVVRLGALGHGDVRRTLQPGPAGAVAMATVRDPDGVLVELVARAPSP